MMAALMHTISLSWLDSYLLRAKQSLRDGHAVVFIGKHAMAAFAAIIAVSSVITSTHLPEANTFSDKLLQLVHLLHQSATLLPRHPAGLKLNVAVADLFVAIFTYTLNVWLAWIKVLFTVTPTAMISDLVIIATMAGGSSLLIALLIDIVSILTFHMKLCHFAMAFCYRSALHALKTFLLLFAGKKHNPFRQRIDSYASSRAHILIGTLFFTVVLFLLPTIAVAHLYFSVVQSTVVITQLMALDLLHLLDQDCHDRVITTRPRWLWLMAKAIVQGHAVQLEPITSATTAQHTLTTLAPHTTITVDGEHQAGRID
eukprot:TRINITY_DN11929_c2_g1_i2.p1 TRINITY_DN11929_c2_g1~~TRINITY_DN11929_c2_g1_i2.p1  ORF type:complete len:314 (+),score=42.29 TRINITY_DN11929_c2_g1_i2:1-942(+)